MLELLLFKGLPWSLAEKQSPPICFLLFQFCTYLGFHQECLFPVVCVKDSSSPFRRQIRSLCSCCTPYTPLLGAVFQLVYICQFIFHCLSSYESTSEWQSPRSGHVCISSTSRICHKCLSNGQTTTFYVRKHLSVFLKNSSKMILVSPLFSVGYDHHGTCITDTFGGH